jgi:hypothetical protein
MEAELPDDPNVDLSYQTLIKANFKVVILDWSFSNLFSRLQKNDTVLWSKD